MNELSAITTLRRLIGHEGSVGSDGRTDLGWCCSEHAFIACLAFALTGRRMLFCEGELLILKREARDGVHVVPHFFLVDDSAKVFDSSVSFEDTEGIPTNAAQVLPQIRVVAGKDRPPIATMHEKLLSSPYRRLFCYCAEAPLQLNAQSLKWVSTTPFGSELAKKFGSQDGLWAKAAWFIAHGTDNPTFHLQNTRDDIWDMIASKANKDDEVSDALEKLVPK